MIAGAAPDEYAEAWTEPYSPWAEGATKDRMRTGRAADINDDDDLTDEARIESLRPIFREVGVTIVWRPDL